MFAGTGVVGEVIAEAEPHIYCLKGFWILPNQIFQSLMRYICQHFSTTSTKSHA
jgi:hypothetical protein